ncbi:MAG TPA: hypothetical protein VMV05_12105 [bacterium]|nr:hypothetical protein [bacterium]
MIMAKTPPEACRKLELTKIHSNKNKIEKERIKGPIPPRSLPATQGKAIATKGVQAALTAFCAVKKEFHKVCKIAAIPMWAGIPVSTNNPFSIPRPYPTPFPKTEVAKG